MVNDKEQNDYNLGDRMVVNIDEDVKDNLIEAFEIATSVGNDTTVGEQSYDLTEIILDALEKEVKTTRLNYASIVVAFVVLLSSFVDTFKTRVFVDEVRH